MGIDEAGRGKRCPSRYILVKDVMMVNGPVCGPMTYGACYGPIDGEVRLRKMGFADSKTLSEEKRDALFKVIKGAPDFLARIAR